MGIRQPLKQEHLFGLREKDSSGYRYSKYCAQYEKHGHYQLGRVIVSILLAFKKNLVIVFVLQILTFGAQTLNPFLIKRAQGYFYYKAAEDKPSSGSLVVFASVQCAFLMMSQVVSASYQFEQKMVGVYIQGALQSQIFRKTMRFPTLRNPVYNPGDLINLLQVDTFQASQYFTNLFSLVLLPLQFAAALVVFILTVGNLTVILGVVLQVLFGLGFGFLYGRIQKKFMHAKDLRMRLTDEMLLAVKQIKLNSLEPFFQQRINASRNTELKYLRNQLVMLFLIALFMQLSIVGIFEITFLFRHDLSFIFIALLSSNYQTISSVLNQLPSKPRYLQFYSVSLKDFIVCRNSMHRITLYLLQPDLLPLQQQPSKNSEDFSLRIKNGNFSWKYNENMEDTDTMEYTSDETQLIQNSKKFAIRNIELEVKKGQFVAVIGNAGSGKSSLLKSILGEMQQEGNSSYEVNGICTLASQEPWIISGTVRENITYLQPFEEDRYGKVVEVCGLSADLASFPGGDQMMLGEKGQCRDNLSGGQQKRINLARAVYQDCDIYLLDDPLSALDIRMKLHILERCILGMLREKSVVVFTNTIANLQKADRIYVMEKGEVVKEGTFGVVQEYLGQSNSQRREWRKKSRVELEEGEFEDVERVREEEKQDEVFEAYYYAREEEQEQEQEQEQLINSEDQQEGAVRWAVVRRLAGSYGGALTGVLTLAGLVLFVAPSVVGNKLLATLDPSEPDFKARFLFYYLVLQLPITLGLSGLQALYFFFGLRTSRSIHEGMIQRLLRASFTRFYNAILLGRLMNRLSKDLYNLDVLLSSTLYSLFSSFGSVLLMFLGAIFFLNAFTYPVLLAYLLLLSLQAYSYFKCVREVTRIGIQGINLHYQQRLFPRVPSTPSSSKSSEACNTRVLA